MSGDNDCGGQECQKAAEMAVKKVFAMLGVDVDKPESIKAFREDLMFGSKMRRASDRGMMAFFGAIGVGIAAAIWAGVVSKMTGTGGP